MGRFLLDSAAVVRWKVNDADSVPYGFSGTQGTGLPRYLADCWLKLGGGFRVYRRSIRLGLRESECRNALLPIGEVVFGVKGKSDEIVVSINGAGLDFDDDSVWIVSQWFAPCVGNCGDGYNDRAI